MMELETNKKLSHEATKILANLRTKLPSIAENSEDDDEPSHITSRLDSMNNKFTIQNYGPDDAKEYLEAMDKARRLVNNEPYLETTGYESITGSSNVMP
ncbi:hypothetical protein OSB04_000444 [Centaurea solstitialis]|uniref:Uncharacterized protein n=1 Tax=Centaurea solstitialis TaxID=347529 RepID=A0AA38TP30_9ASTR|nr:hypothetical protein OSB04_000444 [Centaurea solstitialis]